MNEMDKWDNNRPGISRFRDDMGGLIQRFFNDPFFWNDNFLDRISGFHPALNVKERSNEYIVEAEVPGVNPGEVDIEIHGNQLMIKGERRMEEEQKDEEGRVHRMESRYGSFQRSFTLPEDADPEQISADSHSGIITVRIPKNEATPPRKIDVQNRNIEQ